VGYAIYCYIMLIVTDMCNFKLTYRNALGNKWLVWWCWFGLHWFPLVALTQVDQELNSILSSSLILVSFSCSFAKEFGHVKGNSCGCEGSKRISLGVIFSEMQEKDESIHLVGRRKV